MFTTVCLIHKDNDNIRNELEKLGIKPHPCMYYGNNNFLFVNRGFYNNIETGYEEESLRAIDCGENEELFLAIAALRNDTDKNQWFTDNKDEEFWIICGDDKIDETKKYYQEKYGYFIHKATVAELFNFFN